MIYNIWFIGMIITFLILKVGFINNIGIYVEWKINNTDLSKLGGFIVCLIASIFWPITWVITIIISLIITIIDLFYDSNS